MARNGSGTYSLPAGNPVTTGAVISSTWANNTLDDLATAMTASIAKDGQTTPTADLPMGTYKHTGVGAATARTQYGRAAEVQDGTLTHLTSPAGTNTITASAGISMSAYVVGQVFSFVPANTNTGATTLNINSIGAGAVQAKAAACVGGEIVQNVPIQVKVTATTPVFEIIGNGAVVPLAIATHAATSKTTPVAADEVPLVDSAASNVLKKLTWANLLATILGTANTWNADQTLAENVGIVLDAALSADGKYSGIVEAGTAAAALAFGQVCYFVAASSRWNLAKADVATTSAAKLGICVLAAAANGDPTVILLFGKVRADSLYPTFTIGAPVYVSAATAGSPTSTAPTGTTDFVVRKIGAANSGDELFFNPSNDYVTLV